MVKIVDIITDKPIDGVVRATIFGKVTNMTLSTNQIYTLLAKGAKVSEVLSNGERLPLSIRNYNTINETNCIKKAAEEARIKEEAAKKEAEAKAEAERLAAEDAAKKAAEEARIKEEAAKKEAENKKKNVDKKNISNSPNNGNKNEDPQQ